MLTTAAYLRRWPKPLADSPALLRNLWERAVPVRLVTNAGDFSNNAHMLSSVSKNRELYLRVLTPTFIVNWGEVEPELTK